MRAFRLLDWGKPAEFVQMDIPRPGPDEVLVGMGAVGLCHTDLHLLDAPAGTWAFEPPFTLGHENAGWVAEGAAEWGLAAGDPVLISGVHSCGYCPQCLRGLDNYCWIPTSLRTRGVGEDGGLAEFMVAPKREIVPLATLTPHEAATLADAGATSYHAVKVGLPRLVPGSTAVVVGAGGLGGYAVQFIRLLTAAQVVAVDLSPTRLEYAREVGAHEVVFAGTDAAQAIRALTGGKGANAVFDFVGVDETLRLAAAISASLGTVVVCGMGGGAAKLGWGSLAPGCEFVLSLASTMTDLREVVAMAEAGLLHIEAQFFSFDDVSTAYDALRAGELRSRAVVQIQ